MKLKHNKKRNSLFLYEALIKTLTKAILDENEEKKNVILGILKEFFIKNKPLYAEVELYRILSETYNLKENTAKRLLNEVYRVYHNFNQNVISNEQNKLISKVNKEVGKDAYNAFVPSYRNLASIYQLFHKKMSPKERVLLEDRVVEQMTKDKPEDSVKEQPKVNNLELKLFVEGFNKEYSGSLLSEQKQLLEKYVLYDVDYGSEFKFYLNEELGRLKTSLKRAIDTQEDINEDENMKEQTKKIYSLLEEFASKQNILEEDILKVLKVQKLVSEIEGPQENDQN